MRIKYHFIVNTVHIVFKRTTLRDERTDSRFQVGVSSFRSAKACVQCGPKADCVSLIDHIHNNRLVGFDIVMQISHVVCQGANIKMMRFLRKSAGLNSEVSAPKSHLEPKCDIMISLSRLV